MRMRIDSKVRTTLGPSKRAVHLRPGKSVVVDATADELKSLLAHGNGHGAHLVEHGLVRVEEAPPEYDVDVDEGKDGATAAPRARGRKKKDAAASADLFVDENAAGAEEPKVES